jgi:hypothetical protein
MTKTRAELKAELMAVLEQEVESLLDWESQAAIVTLTDIEEKVVAMRRRVSERLASSLAQRRVERLESALPTNAAGARLHRKGKKRERARHGSGS